MASICTNPGRNRAKMRITISCKYFSARGGAQTFLSNFVRSLLEDGHRVRVLALEADWNPDGVEIIRLPTPPVPKMLRDLAYARASRKSLAQDDADVSFGEQKSWGADVVRPGGGVHHEYIAQSIKSYPGPALRAVRSLTKRANPKELLNLYIEKQLYRPPGPRCVIANSKMVRRHLIRHYPFLSDRIALIYNGADCERFHPGLKQQHRRQVRRELDIPDHAIVGVFVSYDWRRKGLRTAIESLAILRQMNPPKPAYCIVVGKGKKRTMQFLARRLGVGDRLRFVGVGEPDRFYGASDLLVLPTYFDPCANVTFEALACGLPALTTVHDGAHERLTPGVDGFAMSAASDAAQLAGFIHYFMDEGKLAAAAQAARRTALSHTLQDMYRQLKDVIIPIAEEKRRERR